MTRATKKRLSEKMKAVWAARKAARMTPKEVHEQMNKLAQPQNEAQQPAVDIRRMEEYNYRRGLLDAMECILREVRHS